MKNSQLKAGDNVQIATQISSLLDLHYIDGQEAHVVSNRLCINYLKHYPNWSYLEKRALKN
ncbi:hypothetical protein C7Y47_00765 [Lysinibacillus sphaericus]|uniref:Uncharacterized protein n=1 Tax=Lysinibacillus sphaericus TaxID=1421 RepID=A0A544V0H2_LYSSH|nr:hypothetical protein [Lysinibacillus sp. SDF0037]TQR39599.1 hypothetical protein C7Y47_00765 [Lysinibacillus sp. SDF0037]